MDTYPAWVGRLLNAVLPRGEQPLAMYYSWTHDERAVHVVVVLPTALVGVEMAFVDHSDQALNASVAAVPLHRAARVRLASRAWLGSDPDAALQNVEIEIDGELPPFGSSISLPIARDDYKGDADVARQVARRIADVLIATFPTART
jgi:hypothetical protein